MYAGRGKAGRAAACKAVRIEMVQEDYFTSLPTLRGTAFKVTHHSNLASAR